MTTSAMEFGQETINVVLNETGQFARFNAAGTALVGADGAVGVQHATKSPPLIGYSGSVTRGELQNIPNASNGLQVIGYDTNNDVAFTVGSYGGGDGNFLEINSASSASPTNSTGRSVPASWNYIRQCIVFKGKLYLFGATGGLVTVWNTTPTYGSGTTYTWTPVFQASTGANNTLGGGARVSSDGNWLYYGEYGDPTNGPTLWRTNDGTTWTAIWGRGAIATLGFSWPNASIKPRHIHCINFDPYSDIGGTGIGDLWMTCGDGGVRPLIARSTDGGFTFVEMVDAVDNSAAFQAVEISFSPNYVWFASDQEYISVAVYDRVSGTIRNAAANTLSQVPVLGGGNRSGGNLFTDGAFTSGSKTVTSSSAAFTANDKGRYIAGELTARQLTHIAAVISATEITMSNNATGTGTNKTFTISEDVYDPYGYMGIVDPQTEIFYSFSQPQIGGSFGLRHGLMTLTGVGGQLRPYCFIPPIDLSATTWPMYICGNWLYFARWRVPLANRYTAEE